MSEQTFGREFEPGGKVAGALKAIVEDEGTTPFAKALEELRNYMTRFGWLRVTHPKLGEIASRLLAAPLPEPKPAPTGDFHKALEELREARRRSTSAIAMPFPPLCLAVDRLLAAPPPAETYLRQRLDETKAEVERLQGVVRGWIDAFERGASDVHELRKQLQDKDERILELEARPAMTEAAARACSAIGGLPRCDVDAIEAEYPLLLEGKLVPLHTERHASKRTAKEVLQEAREEASGLSNTMVNLLDELDEMLDAADPARRLV